MSPTSTKILKNPKLDSRRGLNDGEVGLSKYLHVIYIGLIRIGNLPISRNSRIYRKKKIPSFVAQL
jgi:hypothetical protein